MTMLFNGCRTCRCKLAAAGVASICVFAALAEHNEYCGERAPFTALCNPVLSWDLTHGPHNDPRPWQQSNFETLTTASSTSNTIVSSGSRGTDIAGGLYSDLDAFFAATIAGTDG
jgi:hypothetical protein